MYLVNEVSRSRFIKPLSWRSCNAKTKMQIVTIKKWLWPLMKCLAGLDATFSNSSSFAKIFSRSRTASQHFSHTERTLRENNSKTHLVYSNLHTGRVFSNSYRYERNFMTDHSKVRKMSNWIYDDSQLVIKITEIHNVATKGGLWFAHWKGRKQSSPSIKNNDNDKKKNWCNMPHCQGSQPCSSVWRSRGCYSEWPCPSGDREVAVASSTPSLVAPGPVCSHPTCARRWKSRCYTWWWTVNDTRTPYQLNVCKPCIHCTMLTNTADNWTTFISVRYFTAS